MLPSEEHWQFRSLTNFTVRNILVLLAYAGFTCVNILCLKKRNLFYIVVLLDIIILLLVLRYHYLFQQAGYDHYPGFDPYFI